MREPISLLACFAAFYEQVAMLKTAARNGTLAACLSEPGLPAPAGAEQLAERMQALLGNQLDQQKAHVALHATDAELRAYCLAQMVMAAVADEALVLDLDWPGRTIWLGMLLEARLFHTRNAGSQLFELADQLLSASDRSVLQRELAAVLLLALQLGFKGRWRGAEGASTLERYRASLYKLAHQAGDIPPHPFAQAYAYRVQLPDDARLAPLAPWLRAGIHALLWYFGLSGAFWFWTSASAAG